MRRSGGASLLALQAATVVMLVGLLALPIVELLLTSASQGPGVALGVLARPGTLRAAGNTLWVSAAASLLAVSVAMVAAHATALSRRPGASTMRVLILLPLLVPPFAAAIGWSQAYGPGGIVQLLVGHAVPGIVGPLGVLLVTSAEVTPIAYLVLSAALRVTSDADLTLAARVSGSTAVGAFLRVTVRLLRPALAASLALCFVSAANNFAVPAVLGQPAGFETLTTRIYNELNFAADPNSFVGVQVLASVLVILTLVASMPAARFTGDRELSGGGAAPDRGPRPLLLVALAVYLVATTLVPLAALLLTALDRAVGLAPLPTNWSTVNFSAALQGSRFPASLGNSVLLATLTATLVVAFGLGAAAARRGRVGKVLANAMILGFAVPGSVLAIALLLAYGQWIGGSLLILLLAYVAKLSVLGHRPLVGALERLPRDLGLAARASGATARQALWTITIPLLMPAMAAAWVLVFIFAVHEVTISSLLYGPSTQTLAVLVLSVEQSGDIGTTAALACIMTAMVLVPAILLPVAMKRLPPPPGGFGSRV